MSGDPRWRRPPGIAVAWAEEVTGRRVVSVEPLTGGMSTATDRLLLEGGGGAVLRRFLNRRWVDVDPGLAVREAAVLRHLEPSPVPAPPLIGVDPDGGRCGAPALLTGLMPGRRRADGDAESLGELARALASIHLCGGLPDANERLWRAFEADEPIRPEDGAPPNPELWALVRDRRAAGGHGGSTLVHNDFSYSNVLFVGERVSAVLDWNEAATGEAACDVSFCRINLALTLGLETADLFLAAYEVEAGISPPGRGWWDLVAAARVEPDLDTWTASANYLGPPGLSAADLHARFSGFLRQAIDATA